MIKPEQILSDRDIKQIHGNADFGSTSQREVIDQSLLKVACGYQLGSVAKEILIRHDLIAYNSLTVQGRKYLWALYGKESP